jgi:hypothetical protein
MLVNYAWMRKEEKAEIHTNENRNYGERLICNREWITMKYFYVLHPVVCLLSGIVVSSTQPM